MFAEFVQQELLLFIALAIVVAMLVYSYVGDRLAGFKAINTAEAVRLYNDDAFLLDVRTAAEFKEEFIGNAVNVSVNELAAKQNQLPKDKETPILVYCLTGARSQRVAGTLAKQGYKNVYNLSGGINAWKTAGLPITSAKSKRKQKNK